MLREILAARIARLDAEGLRRSDATLPPTATEARGQVAVWCSNDYLGLAQDPRVQEGAARAAREVAAGASGSRLVTGTTPVHIALEAALCAWLGTERVLLFGSGYQANVGLMQALVGPRDVVFSDERNHASLIDGMRLCRGRREVFAHNDLEDLAQKLAAATDAELRVVVVESIYSMDGDAAPLEALCDLCEAHNAVLVVDEAHALGVRGTAGRGLADELGLAHRVPIRVGTLGKSFGTAGAFVAGPAELRDWLFNRARSFVFATAPVPAVCGAALASLPLIEAGTHQAMLWERIRQLAAALGAAGLWTPTTDAERERGAPEAAIFPLHVGDPIRTVAASRLLLERGYFVQAIRPPTVPPGTARLRLTVSAAHQPAQIDGLVAALQEALSSV